MISKQLLNLIIFSCLSLMACNGNLGGGEDTASTLKGSTTTSTTHVLSTTTTTTNQLGYVTIHGRVSNGNPLFGVQLSTQCGTETQSTQSPNTSSSDGSFSVVVFAESFPCIVNATTNSITLRSISTESGDIVNVNPVSNLIVEEQVTPGLAAPRYDAYGRTLSRRLSEITTTLFNENGNTIVNRVFTGGFSFSTDFDKDYINATTNVTLGGANLADTLFRSVDESVGSLSDISTIIKRANDPTDESVSGGFLNDPAFQAVVASEIVAVSGGSETIALDDEIGVLSTGVAIADVRETITALVKNETDIQKAARVTGALLKEVVKNTSNVTDLNQVATNVVMVAGDTIKAIVADQDESDGKAIGEQIGITLAKATDFTNATSVAAKLDALKMLAGNTKTTVESSINRPGLQLNRKQKVKFWGELNETTMDLIVANDPNFINTPKNSDSVQASNVALNTAAAFNQLAPIFSIELSNLDAVETVFEDAGKLTKRYIKDIVAADPFSSSEVTLPNGFTNTISISEQTANVGKNIGDFITTYTSVVVHQAETGTTDSNKAASIVGSTMAVAFQKALKDSENDVKGTGSDLIEATNQATIDKAGNVAAILAAQVDSLVQSGNFLDIAIFVASDRAMRANVNNRNDIADETNDGLVQIIVALLNLEQKGFSPENVATIFKESDLEAKQVCDTLEIMENSSTHVSTSVNASQADTIVELSVQTASQSSVNNANTNSALVVTTLLAGVKNQDFVNATSTIRAVVDSLTKETLLDVATVTAGVDITDVDVDWISRINVECETNVPTSVPNIGFGPPTSPKLISLTPLPNTRYDPENGHFGVGLTENIVIAFDKVVQFGVGNVTISNGDGNQAIITVNTQDPDGTVSFSSDRMVVTIDPSDNFTPLATYTITVDAGAFKDTLSTPLGTKEISWSFQTGEP